MARKPTVLPPATDSELAAAERRDVINGQRRLDEEERVNNLEALADAGEPEARELLKGRFKPGITAMVSAIKSEPIEPPTSRQKRFTLKAAPAPPDDDHRIKERDTKQAEQDPNMAYQLMDLYFRRWSRDAKRDPNKATRDLGIALGGDTVLFMRAGIVRFADAIDQLKKLIDTGRKKSDLPDDDAEYDDQIGQLQKQMRGE